MLVGRSDASMHRSGVSAGIGAEAILFYDHQHSEVIATLKYHISTANIHVAEWMGVLLITHAFTQPEAVKQVRGYLSCDAEIVIQIDWQILAPWFGCTLQGDPYWIIIKFYTDLTEQVASHASHFEL